MALSDQSDFGTPSINVATGRWTVMDYTEPTLAMREFPSREAAQAWIDERRLASDEDDRG